MHLHGNYRFHKTSKGKNIAKLLYEDIIEEYKLKRVAFGFNA